MSKIEDPIAKLDDQITCKLCNEHFKFPKVLLCHHAYCKECLDKLLEIDKKAMEEHVFECPECHKHTPVPLHGAAGLDTAFQVVQLMELRETLQRAQGPLARGMSTTESINEEESPEEAPPSLKKPANMCPRHEASERKVYCECGEVICFQCVKDHPGHKYDLVSYVAGKHREDLKSLMDPLENKALDMERALSLLGAQTNEISDQRDIVRGQIDSFIEDLHHTLELRKEALIGKLNKVASKKLKELDFESSCREMVHAQLTSDVKHIKDTLDKKSEVEMVASKTTLVLQAGESSKAFDAVPDLLNVEVEADMVFSSPADIKNSSVDLGQILTLSSPDPANCICTGEGLQNAKVEEPTTVTVQVRNYLGKPINMPIPSLECELTFQETPISCEIQKTERNLYEISYMPTNRGKHELHIKIEGEHIRNSPFFIDVRVPVESLGEPVMTIDAVRPWSVAINKAGELIVTECNLNQVTIFSMSGDKLQTFGGKAGSDKMQFHHPCGVIVDDEDNIYVSEGSNHRIQKFTRNGTHIGFVGQAGNGPEDFTQPKSLAFNRINRRIYLADFTSVKVLNKDLTLHKVIGSKGTGRGKFIRVFGVTCAPNGDVYVSDASTKYIQVFTPEGNFIKWFQSEVYRPLNWNPFGDKEVTSPANIFADSEYLYVSSDSHFNITIFKLDGKCIHSFGHEGFDTGDFRAPRGIAVSKTGMVYVCDNQNDRIQVF